MWEEITPRDQRPQHAYLDGVDRSDAFVLLVGTYYGVSDETGFSPTHKERNHAAERGIPRLLFQRAGVRASDREGKLNNLVRSLYAEVSGGEYADVADLTRKLEARLRETASAQETYWVKLGSLVFSGTVRRQSSGGATTFVVKAKVRDGAVRAAIGQLGSWSSRIPADRLTWGNETHPVQVERAEMHGSTTSEDEVELTCRLATDRGSGLSVFADATFEGVGPLEQVPLWAGRALFGEAIPRRDTTDLLHSFTKPDGPSLPELLAAHEAREWLAEGLARLYLVEGLMLRFGGQLERIQVGPSTSTGVRIAFVHRLGDYERPPVAVSGVVPLP